MGIFHNKVPAFAFNPMPNKKLHSFPEDLDVNYSNLDWFVGSYLSNNYVDAR